MILVDILKGIATFFGGVLFILGCSIGLIIAAVCAIPALIMLALLFAGAWLMSLCDIEILDSHLVAAMDDLKPETKLDVDDVYTKIDDEDVGM